MNSMFFIVVLGYSFFVALVLTLKITWKYAIMIAASPLLPLLIFGMIWKCLGLKYDMWMENYDKVTASRTTIRVIRNCILPLVLVGLLYSFQYYYKR